jgi:membrane protease YdiL (CAAX protease family)
VGGALAGRHTDGDLATGIVAVWVVLGAVTTVVLPGFSFLFIWPALAGVLALAGSSSGRLGGWLWLVVAAPAVVLAIPALDAFFQMAQPRPGNPNSDLTVAVTLVGLLAALVVGLVVPFRPASRPRPRPASDPPAE